MNLNQLKDWFLQNGRDLPWRGTTRDPYKVWVSEIMLQQTQVVTVIPYFKRFITAYPDIFALADADEPDILKQWEGLGYYTRARNMHKASRIIVTEYNGRIPNDYIELKKLPGIGDYVASAILAFGYKKRIPVVDGNVLRVMTRILCIEEPVDQKVRKRIRDELERLLSYREAWLESESLMELGALICTPKNPSCVECPVKSDCISFARKVQEKIPVRQKGKPVPIRKVVVGIILSGNQIYIQRRTGKSHLAGLWEFPGGKIEQGEDSLTALIREIKEETGMGISDWEYISTIKHAYSHFKIEMDVYITKIPKKSASHHPEGKWVEVNQLKEIAFPAANHKIFKILKKLNILEL